MSAGDDRATTDALPRRRRWFRKRGIDLADLAVNSFAAFLGVFIALMVQNWTASNQTRQKIDQARTAIREEILANRTALSDQNAYYVQYMGQVKKLSSMPMSRDNGCDKREAGWQGFRPPLLLHSAYDTGVATGTFAQMDFAESQRIAALYAQQTQLAEFQQRMMDYYIQTWSNQDVPCSDVFGDLNGLTAGLVRIFDTYLKGTPYKGMTP